MKVLLDTSVYSRFWKGAPDVVERVTRATRVLMSPVVLGELMFGFRQGSRYRANETDLEEFLREATVDTLSMGEVTAHRYALVAFHLKSQGTPIPTNDIWIAAQAMEHGAELLTADRHFEHVAGLACTIY